MRLAFLPNELKVALANLNYNYLSEIRIRRGQPVIIEYRGEYKYVGHYGIACDNKNLIIVNDIESIILTATDGCIYNFTEQIKSGFITVENGVRIGIAGEYITQNNTVSTIKNITSLNVRIPHNIEGCAKYIVDNLFCDSVSNVLIYSKPGLGKTTMLRDVANNLSRRKKYNILILDERNEIAALDNFCNGYNLGERVDIIRCYNKLGAITSAIRAMKPDIIITDELYGENDISAIRYARDCGIAIIASSHICNQNILKEMPFDFYIKLVGIGLRPEIYDKNFNSYCNSRPNNSIGRIAFG